MVTGFAPSLGMLVLTQSSSGTTGISIVIAAVAAVFAAVGWMRARSLRGQLDAALKERDQANETIKGLQTRDRESTKRLEERQDEARELKQEVAGLRKKNHAAQEETKALRADLRAQAEQRDRLLASRPAFESTPVKPKPKAAAKPIEAEVDRPAASGGAAKGAPAAAVHAAGEPATATEATAAPATAVAPAPAAATAHADRELIERLANLESERAKLAAALATDAEALKEQKAELIRIKRYAEQLRRIDIISKGKVEILEDKVAALGRQYYEAVSELAIVKGEVPALRRNRGESRRQRPSRSPDGEQRGGQPPAGSSPGRYDHEEEAQPAEEHDATPEADALAQQMDAAAAEVGAEPAGESGTAAGAAAGDGGGSADEPGNEAASATTATEA